MSIERNLDHVDVIVSQIKLKEQLSLASAVCTPSQIEITDQCYLLKYALSLFISLYVVVVIITRRK